MPAQATSASPAALRAAYARSVRAANRQPDNADLAAAVDEAARQRREGALAAHIERIVSEAPPLRPEQVDRLTTLLRGGTR